MTKKIDFSNFGFVLKRLFKSKNGQWTPEDERRAQEMMTEEERRLSAEREATISAGARRRERLSAEEEERWERDLEGAREKRRKEEERAKKSRLTRAREWAEKKGRRPKEILQGKWAKGGEHEDWGGWMFILMAGVLYYLDRYLSFNGINIDKFLNNIAFIGVESYIGWFFNSIVITLLIAYYVIYQPDPAEFISFVLVAEIVSLILFLGGMGVMLVHLAFICAFYFLYIRPSAEKKIAANMITFFLLAFDFFGFGILAKVIDNPIVSNRLIIPIWFYFALIYTRNQERSFWIDLIIFMVIMGNVFYFVGGLNGLKNMGATLTMEERREYQNFVATAVNNIRQTIYKAYEGFRQDINAQLEYASGGYYKGKVEKTKKEPLGVYIEEVKAAEPTFYVGEEAIIWGTLKASGLDEGIIIKIICYVKKLPHLGGTGFAGVGGYADVIIPNKSFMIYQKEHRDFECSFETGTGSKLDEGVNTIMAGAEFGFSTLAYLRAYFMDRDRLRAMRREGLDVLKEFGIKEKEAVAVYTTGPVSIGMETTDPLIGVSKTEEKVLDYTRLGVTLENIEGWDGEIKQVEELILLLPKGLKINNPSEDCLKRPFKEYKLKGDGKDVCFNDFYDEISEEFIGEKHFLLAGKGSCERFSLLPCIDVCKVNRIKKGMSDTEKTKIEDDCIEECKPNYKSCVEDCYVLFEYSPEKEKNGEEIEYTGYTLDLDKIEIKEQFKNVGRFRSFSCRVSVKPDVLGDTPLTIRYFRAKARYNYSIKKEIDVNVESRVAGTKRTYSLFHLPASDEVVGGPAGHFKVEEEIKQRIISYSEKLGDGWLIKYAQAVADQESGFKHCCVGKGSETPCVNTVDCEDISRVFTNGEDFGVMQLNKNAHPEWFKDEPCNKVDIEDANDCKIYDTAYLKGVCKSKDGKKLNAYHADCNMMLGIGYLNNLYGLHSGERRTYKPTGESYTGWNLALRYYNGFGVGGNENYVEDVNKKLSKYV